VFLEAPESRRSVRLFPKAKRKQLLGKEEKIKKKDSSQDKEKSKRKRK